MERFFAEVLNKNKITALIELGRPWNALIIVLFSIIGYLLTITQISWLVLIAAIVSFLVYTAGTSLNDVCDMDVDFINMPYRPLERFQLTVREALLYILFSYLAAVIISLIFSIEYFLTVLLMIFVTYIYSSPPFSLNKRGIMGNIVLSFGSVFTTAYSAHVLITKNFSFTDQFLITVISLMLFFTFFTIIKDFKDVKGDKIRNKKTLPMRIGIKNASFINIIGTAVFFPLTIAMFNLIFNDSLFVFISTMLFVLLLFYEYKIYEDPSAKTGERSWSFSRIIMFLFTILVIFSMLK